jgi:hypothetical protein
MSLVIPTEVERSSPETLVIPTGAQRSKRSGGTCFCMQRYNTLPRRFR